MRQSFTSTGSATYGLKPVLAIATPEGVTTEYEGLWLGPKAQLQFFNRFKDITEQASENGGAGKEDAVPDLLEWSVDYLAAMGFGEDVTGLMTFDELFLVAQGFFAPATRRRNPALAEAIWGKTDPSQQIDQAATSSNPADESSSPLQLVSDFDTQPSSADSTIS